MSEKRLEDLIDDIEDVVVSHPGNMRCLRLECRLDDHHDPYWTVRPVDHFGRYFQNWSSDSKLIAAIEKFLK